MIDARRVYARVLLAALLSGSCAGLSGCTGAVFGAGATVAAASIDERGIRGVATDAAILANINALWIDYDADIPIHVDATVSEGRVLLTGLAPTQKMRLDAVRIAWRSPGVRSVINEIQIGNADDIGTYARDTWITTQLVSRLTVDNRVESINFSVETANHVVYLMGIAQDRAELDRVRNHARQVPYVRRIVSYVRLKGQPAPGKGS